MSISIAELLDALPDDESGAAPELPAVLYEQLYAALAERPVPVGALHRFWRLGDVQARIAVAYLFHWIRGWFQNSDQRQRDLVETHLAAALRLLETMGYLRGAVMKLGQLLANFKDQAPDQLVATLERLHFEAPPMHYSLIREQLIDELGGDPQEVFAEFETEAFAAASLGQVHRGRLRTGERVAVKVQYPGIARTIRADLRNLTPLLLPARLSSDWENTKAQVEQVRCSLERETDYELEAELLERARRLFSEDDQIVVPRVYRQYCTRRVLTMQHLDGVHLHEFLAAQPSQATRDAYATKMLRAWYRLFYAGRLEYIDWHPGNFLFHDGQLGLIDMGGVVEIDDEAWKLMELGDRAMQSGERRDIVEFVCGWCYITDREGERERLDWAVQYCQHAWKPRLQPGPYDFGNADELRRTIQLLADLTRRRYTRGHSLSPLVSRWELAYRTMLYRLSAKIDVHPIQEEEVKAAGWPVGEW